MKEYCCEEFQWRYTTSAGMGLNIRVARLIKDSELGEVSFYITEGYTHESKGVKFCKIDYCPFCGIKLKEYYKDHEGIINSDLRDFALL